MSSTIVDFPKVCQMLDNGWQVTVFKNGLKSYSALGHHKDGRSMTDFVLGALWGRMPDGSGDLTADFRVAHTLDGGIITDDFTPEQALTRLAYKVQGEILGVKKT